MRLPLSKVYRAFPELDRFGDEQCRRFVRWARSKVRFRIVLLPVAAGVAWLMGVHFVASLVVPMETVSRGEKWIQTTLVVLVLVAVGASIVVGHLVRDAILIHAIRTRIRSGRCPECGFSLLGLPIADGAIVCPECGSQMTLHELGLEPRDLLVKDSMEDG